MIVFHLTPVVKMLLILFYIGVFYYIVVRFKGNVRKLLIAVMIVFGVIGYSVTMNFANEKEMVYHQLTNENNVMSERLIEPVKTDKKFDYEKELNSSDTSFTKEQNQIRKQVVKGY